MVQFPERSNPVSHILLSSRKANQSWLRENPLQSILRYVLYELITPSVAIADNGDDELRLTDWSRLRILLRLLPIIPAYLNVPREVLSASFSGPNCGSVILAKSFWGELIDALLLGNSTLRLPVPLVNLEVVILLCALVESDKLHTTEIGVFHVDQA